MRSIPYTSISGTNGGIAILKYGDYLYTAGGDNLSVYELSDPANPRKLRSLGGFGQCRQMAISDGILYLTARNYGLWILSLKKPALPKVITRFDTLELATGLAVHGNYAFVTERIFGIEVIDCRDPYHPRHISQICSDEAQSAFFHKGKLYAGEWGSCRLSVFDYANPYAPELVAQYPLGGFGDGVAIQDDICCCATGLNSSKNPNTGNLTGDGHGLDLFKLDEKGIPRHISRIAFPVLKMKSNDFWSVRLAGKYAFVADTFNGVFQVDISDPFHPVAVGRMILPEITKIDGREGQQIIVKVPDCAGGVAVGDGFLYVIGHKTGLHVGRLKGADERQIASQEAYTFATEYLKGSPVHGFETVDLGGQVRRVSVDEKHHRIFAACSHAGIKILSMSGEKAKVIAQKAVRCSYDLIYRNGKLYSAEGTDGLAIYHVKDNDFSEIGRFRSRLLNIQLITLSENGRFIIGGCHDPLLRFFDVSRPEEIKKVRRHRPGSLLYDDSCPEHDLFNRMVVNWPYCGFCWYDFSGSVPKILCHDRSYRPSGQCEGVAIWRENFLFNTINGEFRLFDPKNPKKPSKKLGNGCGGIPSIDGDFVAIARHREKEVRCFLLSNKSVEFVKERSISGLTGFPGRIAFYQHRMVIPCAWQGLLIEKRIQEKGKRKGRTKQ